MKRLFCWFRRDIRSSIARALKVRPRGGVRNDNFLSLVRVVGQSRVEWCARNIHPWDRGLPASIRAESFLQQALVDTDAVIVKLFQALPAEIETIEIRVLHPISREKVIIAGTIDREDISRSTSPSLKMRLKMLGVNYSCVRGNRIEALSIDEAASIHCA
jgi:hypothetical protein